MKAARSIFNSVPLHLKEDKTSEPFTSLIQIDWIHLWPQGASSHCSFTALLLRVQIWHCTAHPQHSLLLDYSHTFLIKVIWQHCVIQISIQQLYEISDLVMVSFVAIELPERCKIPFVSETRVVFTEAQSLIPQAPLLWFEVPLHLSGDAWSRPSY